MSKTVSDPAATAASGAEGTPASGDASATEDRTASGGGGDAASGGVDFEAMARTWQSRYDQAQAELASLKASAASSSEKGDSGNGSPDPSAVPITQADLIATLGRVEQMRSLTSQLQSEFPNADKSVFANALSYQSPEAYLAAARQSHEAKTAEKAEWRKEIEAEWRERFPQFAAQFETPAAGAQGDTSTGGVTLEAWLGMSLAEREKAYAENPEAWDKLHNSVG